MMHLAPNLILWGKKQRKGLAAGNSETLASARLGQWIRG